MAYNTTLPTTAQALETGVMPAIRNNLLAIAMMLEPTDAGAVVSPVAGLRRFNASSGLFERFSGSAWSEEATGYLKSATAAATYLAIDGTAAAATKLATARTINGVPFDGTSSITVADGTKLPLSGGALSGPLEIQTSSAALGVTIRGRASDDVSTLRFTGGDGTSVQGQIQGRTGTDLRISATSGNIITFYVGATLAERFRVTDTGPAIGSSPVLSRDECDARYAQLAGAPTFSGLVKGRGGGLGLGRISVTTTTGTPSGMSAGDLVLVY